MAKLKSNKESALKTLFVFFIYFSYSYIIQILLSVVGISNSVLSMFLADICFFVLVIILYKKNIRDSYLKLKTEYSVWKKVKIIFSWFGILLLLNIVGGMLTNLIISSQLLSDDNTVAIYKLSKVSIGYTLFKTTLFSTVAEELVFKQAIRDVVDDNVLFVLISSIVYGLINIAYSNFSIVTVTDFVQCFLFSTVLSYAYVKYDDNIVFVMLIKFVYTLIPLTLMLVGV